MQLSSEQRLKQMSICAHEVIANKEVWRLGHHFYHVNGEDVILTSRETVAAFWSRLVAEVFNPPSKKTVTKRHHPCADCGTPVVRRATRCRECSYRHMRKYPYAPCVVCGQEHPAYRNGGRGSRHMLNAVGVCENCKAEYVRQLCSGEG